MKKSSEAAKYHHGDLRRAILEGALELITEAGMANLSLRAVSRKIGVTTAAPYHHFKDRGELLMEIARQGFEELQGRLTAARDRARQAGEEGELEAEARAYLRFAWENTAVYSVMFSGEMAEQPYCGQLKPVADRSFALVWESVALQSGRGQRESAEAALCVWAMLHGLIVLGQSGLLQEARVDQERIAVAGLMAVVGGAGSRE